MAQSWLKSLWNLFRFGNIDYNKSAIGKKMAIVNSEKDQLHQILDSLTNSPVVNTDAGTDPLDSSLALASQYLPGSTAQSFFNQYTGAGLDARSVLQSALNTDLQMYLYNKTQSPVAQVEQYKQAGLNPFALSGGSIVQGVPSLSGNSANAQNLGSLLSSILPLFLKSKELKLEASIEHARLEEEKRQFDLSLEENQRVHSAQIGLWTADTELTREKILSESKNREYLQKRIESEDARLKNLNLENTLLETESLMKQFDLEHQPELHDLYVRAQESEIEARKQNNARAWAQFREAQRQFEKQFTLAANQFYVDSNMSLAEIKMKGIKLGLDARELGIKEELAESEKKVMWIKAISSAVGAGAGTYAAVSRGISNSPKTVRTPTGTRVHLPHGGSR